LEGVSDCEELVGVSHWIWYGDDPAKSVSVWRGYYLSLSDL